MHLVFNPQSAYILIQLCLLQRIQLYFILIDRLPKKGIFVHDQWWRAQAEATRMRISFTLNLTWKLSWILGEMGQILSLEDLNQNDYYKTLRRCLELEKDREACYGNAGIQVSSPTSKSLCKPMGSSWCRPCSDKEAFTQEKYMNLKIGVQGNPVFFRTVNGSKGRVTNGVGLYSNTQKYINWIKQKQGSEEKRYTVVPF